MYVLSDYPGAFSEHSYTNKAPTLNKKPSQVCPASHNHHPVQDASSKQQTTTTQTNTIISRKDCHLTQPCPSEDKQTNKKFITVLTLYKVYTNHWTELRRAETKRKK